MRPHHHSCPLVACSIMLGIGLRLATVHAAPLFHYLSSERYLEGWAEATANDPPMFDHQRADADGPDFFGTLTVRVHNDDGDGASASARQGI